LILGFARKYEKDTGYGYYYCQHASLFYFLSLLPWVILLAAWVIFDLPLGPGGGIYLPH